MIQPVSLEKEIRSLLGKPARVEDLPDGWGPPTSIDARGYGAYWAFCGLGLSLLLDRDGRVGSVELHPKGYSRVGSDGKVLKFEPFPGTLAGELKLGSRRSSVRKVMGAPAWSAEAPSSHVPGLGPLPAQDRFERSGWILLVTYDERERDDPGAASFELRDPASPLWRGPESR
jgi:hypothetical protein